MHLNDVVLAFTSVIAVTSALAFGTAPLMIAGRGDLARALSSGTPRASTGRRQHAIRRALVVAQLATALVLLTGAGLVARSFHTVGARLISGRTFSDDDRPGSPLVVVVNEALAHRLYPNGDAVGKTMAGPAGKSTIIGVVSNMPARFEAHASPLVYPSLEQMGIGNYEYLLVRTTGAPDVTQKAIIQIMRSMDASLPPPQIQRMSDVVAKAVAPREFVFVLLALFAWNRSHARGDRTVRPRSPRTSPRVARRASIPSWRCATNRRAGRRRAAHRLPVRSAASNADGLDERHEPHRRSPSPVLGGRVVRRRSQQPASLAQSLHSSWAMASANVATSHTEQDGGDAQRSDERRLRPSDWLRLVLPVLLIAALIVAAWQLGYFKLKNPEHLTKAADRAQDVPWLGPIFVAIYAALAAFAAPVSPLAYGAGAVFHTIRGTIFVWLGSLLGATAGYWLARGVWAGTAHRLLGRYRTKLAEVKRGNVFLMTMRVQLLPIVPFGVFNYAAGASKVSFMPFIVGTAVGIIPGSIAAVYAGDRIAAGFTGGGKSAFFVAGGVMLALLVVSFIPTIVDKLRRRH